MIIYYCPFSSYKHCLHCAINYLSEKDLTPLQKPFTINTTDKTYTPNIKEFFSKSSTRKYKNKHGIGAGIDYSRTKYVHKSIIKKLKQYRHQRKLKALKQDEQKPQLYIYVAPSPLNPDNMYYFSQDKSSLLYYLLTIYHKLNAKVDYNDVRKTIVKMDYQEFELFKIHEQARGIIFRQIPFISTSALIYHEAKKHFTNIKQLLQLISKIFKIKKINVIKDNIYINDGAIIIRCYNNNNKQAFRVTQVDPALYKKHKTYFNTQLKYSP